jgi:hypothetical protein
VLGTDHGLVMMSSDGAQTRRLPVAGPLTDCSPVRWWTAASVLTCCAGGDASSANQLVVISLSGAAAIDVTAVNSGQGDLRFGNDMGDVDAWKLASGTFLALTVGCGAGFLSRLTSDRHATKVVVSGVAASNDVVVLGTATNRLLLGARMGCGPGIFIVSYDPAADTSTVLLGPPVNGGSAGNAILYPTG